MREDRVLDDILLHVGFGKRQLIGFFLIYLVTIFYAATHLTYLFAALDSEYRCFVPTCDEESNENYDSDWVRNAIPSNELGILRKCEMYEKISANDTSCSAESFDRTKIIRCLPSVFKDDEYYMNQQYQIFCEDKRWKLSLVGSINIFGILIGAFITGSLSDRYGRKTILLISMTLCGAIGLLRIVSPSYEWYCLIEFLTAVLTAETYHCALVLVGELVAPAHRSSITSVFASSYFLGGNLLALIAFIWRDWRMIIYLTYIPSIFIIFLYWYIPESIRWYASKGKMDEAMKILKKYTNKSVPKSYIESLQRCILKNEEKNRTVSFRKMLRSKLLLLRLFNCYLLWIGSSFVEYGLILNSVTLTTNPYLNVTIVSSSAIVAQCTMALYIGKLGRKTCLRYANLMSAISCLACISVDNKILNLIIYCFGKYGSSLNYFLVLSVTNEFFPTPLRNTVMASCSMMGKIGAMLSPQMPLLGHVWKPLPLIVFAATAIVCGIISFFLPETLNIKLPDTIEKAENIGKMERELPEEIELNHM